MGLVVIASRHLSIRVLTDLSHIGEQDELGIDGQYDAFAQSLYDILPESHSISWSLSYYNTAGGDVSVLVPELMREISGEADASVVSFVMFERPTPIPQV